MLSPRADAASSGTVITIAGNGSWGYSGDGGPATNATMRGVSGLAVGSDGTIYFADSDNFRVRAIDPMTGIVRTVAGNGENGAGMNGPFATNAQLGIVGALATDPARRALYLNEFDLNSVRKVNLVDGTLTIYAGSGPDGSGFSGDGGPANVAMMTFPDGIATDAMGKLSIADAGNFRLRQVNPVTGIINTIAGSGTSTSSGDGGPAVGASFHGLTRVAADRAGNIYVLEGFSSQSKTIRRIDAITGIINTVVGGGTNTPGTGVATNMHFNDIIDMAANDVGELFVARTYSIFKLDLATGLVAPFAGNGTVGFSGDGGPALNAQFNGVWALALVPGGGLILADMNNFRIRYIAPDSINLSSNSGQTSFTLPWVSSLTGDLILANNPNLTNINLAALTTVSGDLVLGGNVSAGNLDLGSLESANNVSISRNTAAGVLDLSSLATVSGDLILEGNTSVGNLDLGSLTSAGNVSVSGNTAAGVLDLGSLATVSGDLVITENPSAGNLDLGSLADVSGNLTIESNAPAGNLDLSSLTGYGCGTNEVTMTLNGGTVEMTNGLTLCTNATLTGSITIDGSITNNGTIEPGASPGRLNITGNLHLNSASRLRLEIGGYASNAFDVVNVGGNALLGGTVSVSLSGNFKWAMTNGASFTVLRGGTSLAGSFANAPSSTALTTTDGYARFTLLSTGDNSVRLTNLQIVDTDNDGLPDWWEDDFGLGKTNPADAGLDSDGDRASNAAEFAAGTDPTNPASAFRLLSIQAESNGVRLTWSAVGGKTYRVQTNGTLPGGFTDNGAFVTAPGTGPFNMNILNPDAITNSQFRYYRLRLGP